MNLSVNDSAACKLYTTFKLNTKIKYLIRWGLKIMNIHANSGVAVDFASSGTASWMSRIIFCASTAS